MIGVKVGGVRKTCVLGYGRKGMYMYRTNEDERKILCMEVCRRH
jgi:hypothetical protein